MAGRTVTTSVCINVQGVYKVSLQFRKFITKANERTDKWKLLQNETCIFKFLLPLVARSASRRRSKRERRINCMRFGSLVMVRNQLKSAQVVKNIVGTNGFLAK